MATKAEQKAIGNQIHFRITAEEAAKIEQNAVRVELSPSQYAKRMALQGKVKSPVVTRDVGGLIYPELGKIGSNINQIARKLNMGDKVLASEFREVKAEFENLWTYVTEGKKAKQSQEKPEKSESTEEVAKKADEELFEDVSSTVETKTKLTSQQTEVSSLGSKSSIEERRCSKCGEILQNHLSSLGKAYWQCPNYSSEDKEHDFMWVE